MFLVGTKDRNLPFWMQSAIIFIDAWFFILHLKLGQWGWNMVCTFAFGPTDRFLDLLVQILQRSLAKKSENLLLRHFFSLLPSISCCRGRAMISVTTPKKPWRFYWEGGLSRWRYWVFHLDLELYVTAAMSSEHRFAFTRVRSLYTQQ